MGIRGEDNNNINGVWEIIEFSEDGTTSSLQAYELQPFPLSATIESDFSEDERELGLQTDSFLLSNTNYLDVAENNFVELDGRSEIIVENFAVNVTGTELLALHLLVLGILVLAFQYVRQIDRRRNVLPNIVHKLCCPVLSVIRWEGFEGDRPIYAILFGCFYTLCFWKPTYEESTGAIGAGGAFVSGSALARNKEPKLKQSFYTEYNDDDEELALAVEQSETEALQQHLLSRNAVMLV